MFNIKRLLYTHVGKILISIILGLGIASLFRKACKDRDCIIFYGPVITDVEGRVFQYGDECYTYKTKATSCKTKNQNVKFVDVSPPPTIEDGGRINNNILSSNPVKIGGDGSGNSFSTSNPSLFNIFGGGDGGQYSIFGKSG